MLSTSPALRRSSGAAAWARNSGARRLVPIRSSHCAGGDAAERRRIEGRGVVDQQMQRAEALAWLARSAPADARSSSRSAGDDGRRAGPRSFELRGQQLRPRCSERWQWITTLAPAACSARTMAAPTRRAPPVTSAVCPARGALGHQACRVYSLAAMGAAYDGRRCRLNAAALQPEEARHSRRRAAGGQAAISRAWRLAAVRRVSAHGAVCAGAGLLQRRQRQVRTPAAISSRRRSCPALFGRCVARQCAEILQLIGGGMLELGAGSGGAGGDVLPSAAGRAGGAAAALLTSWKSARICARASAQRLAALPPALRARVRWLDSLPATPICRRDAGQRSRRRAAVSSVSRSAIGRLLESGWRCRPRAHWSRPTGRGAMLAGRAAQLDASLPAPLPPGYRSELCPTACSLGCRAAAPALSARRGAADRLRACRGASTTTRSARAARCTAISGIARTRMRCCIRGCRTSRAWVDFTRVAEAGSMRDSRSPATALRRRFCSPTASSRIVAASAGGEQARLAVGGAAAAAAGGDGRELQGHGAGARCGSAAARLPGIRICAARFEAAAGARCVRPDRRRRSRCP